jgi:hypothetical protein
LQSGDAARAEQVFRADLKRWPRNAWSLFGLEQALQAQEKAEQARDVRRQFSATWQHADVQLEMNWF